MVVDRLSHARKKKNEIIRTCPILRYLGMKNTNGHIVLNFWNTRLNTSYRYIL